MKNKKRAWIYFLFITFNILFFTNSCEKDQEAFYLKATGEVTDIEGNVYKTAVIGHSFLDMGTQEWMAEGLKVTKYRDGTPITFVSNSHDWHHIEAGTALYSYYDFDKNNYGDIYGALYNGYAVHDPAGLCPDGWRIPTKEEWEVLTVYLGTRTNAGGKMKSTRTAPKDDHPRWDSPNTGANNISGFSALPGGRIDSHGISRDIGKNSFWWSSTIDDKTHYFGYGAHHNKAYMGYSRFHPLSGFSVRCIKKQN